ncbi:MAG: DUF2325 domain-containing protein [Pseudanabaenaceae cyanobacterium bins.68]|nr:DUF2325 domain-containing protein [Pseudanabaenaceae cyanobacterium bins.68]
MQEINELAASVTDLLHQAKLELEQKRIQQQREQQVQELTRQIIEQLTPLLTQVEQAIAEFEQDGVKDSLTKQRLEQTAKELRQQITEAPQRAIQQADRQLILQEERLLDERLSQQTLQWRQELKADLLEMIAAQEDFFSATDAAIAIKGYLSDLKGINALEEVVDALMHQINKYTETQTPVAKMRGSHEQTLLFIYHKALENRSRVERAPDVQPSTKHRRSEKKPLLYTDLEGKVVVFGGHDRLETAVRNRLRDSNVYIEWFSEQGGLQLATQGEGQIAGADLVLIVTGYASHSLTERAIEACKRLNKSYEILSTTGMTRVLETIEASLKARQLAKRWKQA